MTAGKNFRCAASDAWTLNMNIEPWSTIVGARVAPPKQVDGAATFLPQPTIFGNACANCANAFGNSVFHSAIPAGCTLDTMFSAACVEGYKTLLDAFTQCTGGAEMYTASRSQQCKASLDYATAVDFFQPFKALYACRSTGSDKAACYATK